MSQSEQNLMNAFAGESQANRKYLAFAKQADKEGFSQIARLFRAAAEAETVHAHNHLKAAKKINSTLENLKEAVAGETFEFQDMYPPMIDAARAEGNKQAERSFVYANEVEKEHAELFEAALADPSGMEDAVYQVCSVCGHTRAGEAPDNCPVCKAAKQAFFVVD